MIVIIIDWLTTYMTWILVFCPFCACFIPYEKEQDICITSPAKMKLQDFHWVHLPNRIRQQNAAGFLKLFLTFIAFDLDHLSS
jgi:hypothetical protein